MSGKMLVLGICCQVAKVSELSAYPTEGVRSSRWKCDRWRRQRGEWRWGRGRRRREVVHGHLHVCVHHVFGDAANGLAQAQHVVGIRGGHSHLVADCRRHLAAHADGARFLGGGFTGLAIHTAVRAAAQHPPRVGAGHWRVVATVVQNVVRYAVPESYIRLRVVGRVGVIANHVDGDDDLRGRGRGRGGRRRWRWRRRRPTDRRHIRAGLGTREKELGDSLDCVYGWMAIVACESHSFGCSLPVAALPVVVYVRRVVEATNLARGCRRCRRWRRRWRIWWQGKRWLQWWWTRWRRWLGWRGRRGRKQLVPIVVLRTVEI